MAANSNSTADGNKKHDEGYRGLLSRKDNFLHFLKKYIKATWVEGITEEDLVQVETSYIDADYKERESDVIYKLGNKNLYFYVLLELQSSPDFSMPFRLLKYMVNLLDNEFGNTPKEERLSKPFRLPAIVPIVLYNGEEKWTPVMSYKEYTANYGDFGDNIIDFKYILFDLNRYNPSDILTTRKLLDFVFTMDLEHYSRNNEDSKNEYLKLSELRDELSIEDAKAFILWYIYARLGGNVDEEFKQEAVDAFMKGKVKDMTYALGRRYQRDMEREGERREAEKAEAIARKMLRRNKPIEEIMEFTDLSREEVERLQP